MRLRALTTLAVAASATFAAYACAGDSPAGPTSRASPSSHGANDHGSASADTSTTNWNVTVKPLLRATPLASDVVVTKTIGILGGTLTVPGTGLTLVVPPLAVGRSTSFKITARHGFAVAYDFEPSGTKFLVPLVATQSLVGMQGGSQISLMGLCYYPNSTKPTEVSELLSIQVDLLKLTATSTISHFSGYIFASGLEDQ